MRGGKERAAEDRVRRIANVERGFEPAYACASGMLIFHDAVSFLVRVTVLGFTLARFHSLPATLPVLEKMRYEETRPELHFTIPGSTWPICLPTGSGRLVV